VLLRPITEPVKRVRAFSPRVVKVKNPPLAYGVPVVNPVRLQSMICGGDSKIRRWEVMRGLLGHQRGQLIEGIVRVDHAASTDSCADEVKDRKCNAWRKGPGQELPGLHRICNPECGKSVVPQSQTQSIDMQ
jgi:hypothetical protein